MKKSCLVLGGNGFLGSHLVDDLLSCHHRVRVFDRFYDSVLKKFSYPQNGLEVFSGDFLNVKDLEDALKGIDVVFHFISLGSPVLTVNNPVIDIQNNVLGTVNLLDLCVQFGVKRVIYPSSGGTIYGDIRQGYAREDFAPNPMTPYSINKLCVENYLSFYRKYRNLDFIIYRISNPYGERQSTNGTQGVIPILLKKALLGEEVDVYGNSVRDYIYVKDITSFIAENFWKDHKYDIYNLGSGQDTALLDLISVITDVTGIIPKVNQKDKRTFDVERIVLDIKRIKEEFRFAPSINLFDGVKLTFDSIHQSIVK